MRGGAPSPVTISHSAGGSGTAGSSRCTSSVQASVDLPGAGRARRQVHVEVRAGPRRRARGPRPAARRCSGASSGTARPAPRRAPAPAAARRARRARAAAAGRRPRRWTTRGAGRRARRAAGPPAAPSRPSSDGEREACPRRPRRNCSAASGGSTSSAKVSSEPVVRMRSVITTASTPKSSSSQPRTRSPSAAAVSRVEGAEEDAAGSTSPIDGRGQQQRGGQRQHVRPASRR